MNHQQARDILRAAWTNVHGRAPSRNELALTQAIAAMETGYGRVGQFAAMAANGQFNWGALEHKRNPDDSCQPGTVPGMDAKNKRCFFVYPSDEKAASAYLENLTGSKFSHLKTRNTATVLAMSTGSPLALAQAMKISPEWFEASATDYARNLTGALTNVQRALGEPTTLTPEHSTSALVIGTTVLLGSLAAVGTILWHVVYGMKSKG